MLDRFRELNETYKQTGQRVGWSLDDLPTEPQHDGSFHIEIDEYSYLWIVTERGLELDSVLPFSLYN